MKNLIFETYPIKDSMLPFHCHTENLTPQIYYPNWHNEIELLYCISGHSTIFCNSKSYDFTKGKVICINSEQLHYSVTKSNCVYHCLIINNNFCKENDLDTTQVNFNTLIEDSALSSKFHEFSSIYREYEKHNFNIENFRKTELRVLVLELLVHLYKHHLFSAEDSLNSRSPSSKYTKKALSYILDNLSRSVTLDEIAKHVGISKYHLLREFKSFTGHTIVEQINILKCNEAHALLMKGTSVTETAIKCGFDNLPYFSKVFKKYYNISPRDVYKLLDRKS